MIQWKDITGFDWDDGNARKSVDKHGVGQSEAEQVFFNTPLLVLADEVHSQREVRYHALGVTHESRGLHVTFTLRDRDTKIRVISARDMHRKERAIYEQHQEDS
ncbi:MULTISPECIES: BrnT family toxin [unclassified Thioalkalivibrio]|uniref:BrnT family toxin n=1 Tax=unclassified Thioalkalivibrio TaxID=2621013 RepID=UPI000369180D|nr:MULTISPECIES: BrnT family toxin [unclassified Thioalkalivibrio]